YLPLVHYDGDVARALHDRNRTPLRARPPALERWSVIRRRSDHDQVFARHLVVVLRIGRRRMHDLVDLARSRLWQGLENALGLGYALAPDGIDHQPHLARRGVNVFGRSPNFHALPRLSRLVRMSVAAE